MADPETKLFKVNIITTDGLVYSHNSSFLGIRAIDGEQGIMRNHIPLITPLAIADVKVKRGHEMNDVVDHIAVNGGYVDFFDNVATIVSDSAERARNIDVSRAQAAKERATKRLQEAQVKHDEELEERAQIALRRAVNRISVSETIK